MAVTPNPVLTGYAFTEKIGSGSYGSVHKAHFKSGAREVVAVKCVQKSGLAKHECDNIVNEISLLKKLKNEFIVDMKGFEWDNAYIYILMEYCGGGDLSQFIRSRRQLPEAIVKLFLQQLATALKYLRDHNVSHMDLKPQNILLSGAGSRPRLKLADFGFAQKFDPEQTKTALKGSPLYMAPEMVLKRRYDAKVDLWSVGVIMYECLFGHAPYKSSSLDELMAKIQEDTPIVIPPHKISAPCRDLLSKCLQRNPKDRIDFPEFFDHDFLDLEHMPTEDSERKAMDLISVAKRAEKDGDKEEALTHYKSALDYLAPLLHYEKSRVKRLELKKKIEMYIEVAERLKNPTAADDCKKPGFESNASSPSSSMEEPPLNKSLAHLTLAKRQSSFESNPNVRELVQLCAATPQLKTALEIMDWAELYEIEGQLTTALEKYQFALGMILPNLSKEPKGHRKTLLVAETKNWMSRAEKVKELIALQEKEMKNSKEGDSVSEQCIIS